MDSMVPKSLEGMSEQMQMENQNVAEDLINVAG